MAVSRKAMTEGIRTPIFCVLSLTQFYNPSVKNQRFLPAPFTQGSLWVLPHQCILGWFSVKLGATSSGSSSHLPLSVEG